MDNLDMQSIFDLIKEAEESISLAEKATPGIEVEKSTGTFSPLKLRISEQWGKPGSKDRKIIEMFTSNIKGSTFSEKLASLQEFVGECDKNCMNSKDVGEILGSLVFLDALASIIYDFNDKSGGFLFESLIAALLGTSAEQIDTKGGRDQEVVDIITPDGSPMSVKFLFERGSQYIKASEKNLTRDIASYKKPVKYLVGIKNRRHKNREVLSIDFYEFTVGLDPSFREYDENLFGSLPDELYSTADFTVRDLDGSYGSYGLGISQIIGAQKRGRVAGGGGQSDRPRQYKTNYLIGRLDFGSRSQLVSIAQRYVSRLGENLVNIFSKIESLSKNITEYFAGGPDKKDRAQLARNDASQLKTAVNREIHSQRLK
tara:strand:+ start:66 stop:1181 length:1116 start_codon:yes stop_codon:yes gene_type:complete